MNPAVEKVYKNHAELPYIAPEYEQELLIKPIAKRNMIRNEDGFLPGHIILLWRIHFGTYTNAHAHHKYFATTYGIDAQRELDGFVEKGYVRLESAFESLRHLSAQKLKELLREKSVSGLSSHKRESLDLLMTEHYSEKELSSRFELRGYLLQPKGQALLEKYPEVVARHPQKMKSENEFEESL